MKLNKTIIEELGKKLQTGCPAKHAAQAEGLSEAIFYIWKADGKEIAKRVRDKEGEFIKEDHEKLTETQKLKLEFFESISTSTSKGHTVLVAAIYGKISVDWRAAESILSRRFPNEWAKKDYLHADQEVTEKPDKLQEIEDEIFNGVPANKTEEVIKGMQDVIEGARNHKDKEKTQA